MVLKFLGLLVSEAANIQKILSTTTLQAKYRGIDSLHDVRPWQNFAMSRNHLRKKGRKRKTRHWARAKRLAK